MKYRLFDRVSLKTSYSLEISKKNLIKIVNKDHVELIPLYHLLENIKGISDIEYDGHFGPYIFLSIETEYDYIATWLSIEETIKNYLKRGK